MPSQLIAYKNCFISFTFWQLVTVSQWKILFFEGFTINGLLCLQMDPCRDPKMVVTTFCTCLHNNLYKVGADLSRILYWKPQEKTVFWKLCYCEGMYKKLRPPFFGPSIGPFEGALCHSWWTPQIIIIFTGQLWIST